MKIAAVIRISEQCSPDDFEWNTYVKELTPESKISDILDWQKRIFKHYSVVKKGGFLPFKIVQMEADNG
jgi:hypothetical protein